jgi:hypothetical protein
MGLSGVNSGLFFLVLLMWTGLFALLFLSVLWVIADTAGKGVQETDTNWRDWRFVLTKLVALTGVLGAVVALPFTLIWLALTPAQVETAKNSLVNDKIDVAVSDLYAQRQMTLPPDASGTSFKGWEDDITRRNRAIDQLEGLIGEDRNLSPRVSRMFSVYVSELSHNEGIAEKLPKGMDKNALKIWSNGLSVQRSDMEKAVQALGRISIIPDNEGTLARPALSNSNLQAVNLDSLAFERADFRTADMQGADFSGARFQRAILWMAQLNRTDFSWAEMAGVNLSGAQLSGACLGEALLHGAELRTTILYETDLGGAQLQGAELRGASFRFVDLTEMVGLKVHVYCESLRTRRSC